MDSISLVVATVVFIALVVQGGSCLLSEQRPLSVGFLDLLLAALLLFGIVSLRSGQMVIATDFGAVMTLGEGTRLLLGVALVLVGVLPSLCWFRVRKLNGWGGRLAYFLVPGATIGLWAATRIVSLPISDPDTLRVSMFDVWWPPLVVWLTLCLAGIMIALADADSLVLCLSLATALLVPLSQFALRFEDLSDSQSRPMWTILEKTAFALAILGLAYLFVSGKTRGVRIAIVVGALAVSAFFTFVPMRDALRVLLGVLPLTVSSAIVVVSLLHQIRQAKGTSDSGDQPSAQTRVFEFVSKAIPIRRLAGVFHSLSLPIIAFCLIDLFSLGYLTRSAEIAVLFFVWLVFAERLAEGALDKIPELFKNGALQLTVAREIWNWVDRKLARLKEWRASRAQSSTKSGGWVVTLKAILTIVFVLVALTIVDEISNSNKIVVQSFAWAAGNTDADKDSVPQSLRDGLINGLGQLQKDLRPDLIMAARRKSGEHIADVYLLEAAMDSSNVANAVAKSDELQILNVKIPVTYFVSPIQHVVRRLLGTRVISGSVRKSSDSQWYLVLAHSSDGGTWRVFEKTTPDSSNQNQEGCLDEDATPKDSLNLLTDELAFRIASSNPSVMAAGMTNSWEAFRLFRLGLRHRSLYEPQENSAELRKAVDCYRAALRVDQKFALANYRLGRALVDYHQPGAAIDAFQESADANPDFVPALSLEALTQYNFDTYYPNRPVVARSLVTGTARQDQASKNWASILALPKNATSISEKRSTYYGLCLADLDRRLTAQRTDGKNDGQSHLFYLPYFYCSQAEALVSRLPVLGPRDTQERNLEAAILNALGLILEYHRQGASSVDVKTYPNSWNCSANAIDAAVLQADGVVPTFQIWGSRLSRAALKYYRRSLALVPGDPVVRCNEANAAVYVRQDMRFVESLEKNAAARSDLGFTLLKNGGKLAHPSDDSAVDDSDKENVAGYYHRALDEFEAAIGLDPGFFDALDGYSHGVWQWALDAKEGRASVPPGGDMITKAESYAREELRIVRLEQSHDGEMIALDTLGEVLITEGRLVEAREQFALLLAEKREGDYVDESRWDFGQALVCASTAAQDPSLKRTLLGDATKRFDEIRANEDKQEFRPFTLTQWAFDPLLREATCFSAPDEASSQAFPFETLPSKQRAGPGCDRSFVTAEVRKGNSNISGYTLHVWGGGVDERIWVGTAARQSIPLESPSKDRQGYYFAQLEDAEQHVLSRIESVDTHQEKAGCSKNLITLVFQSVH